MPGRRSWTAQLRSSGWHRTRQRPRSATTSTSGSPSIRTSISSRQTSRSRSATGSTAIEITYCTVDAILPGESTARPVSATGMLSVPRKPGPLSTVVYLHGTSVSFYDAVSNPNIFGEFSENGESFDGPPSNAIFAGAGFIYVGPDYLGLGESTVPRHRYFHAATEASSAIDLLSASRRVLAGLRVQQNDKLFTFGFSQGGHSALALHRELQRADVDVTGTATVGGVFDLEPWFLSSFDNVTTVTVPFYVSYILLAYDDVYDVFNRRSDVFRAPFASTVSGLFDMQHFFDDVLAELPPDAQQLLTPSFQAAVRANPQHPMRVRLRQNAVDRWTPQAPLRVYHSPTTRKFRMRERSIQSIGCGAGGGRQVRTLPGFDHVNSWVQADAASGAVVPLAGMNLSASRPTYGASAGRTNTNRWPSRLMYRVVPRSPCASPGT